MTAKKTFEQCSDEICFKYAKTRSMLTFMPQALTNEQISEAAELYAQQFKNRIEELEDEVRYLQECYNNKAH